MPKLPKEYTRIDDVPCRKFKALSINELRMLAPIKLTDGKAAVDRGLLSRLLEERDRLIFVAECARWLLEEDMAKGLLKEPDYEDADDQERAGGLLLRALRRLDLDCPSGLVRAGRVETGPSGIGC